MKKNAQINMGFIIGLVIVLIILCLGLIGI
jgi:hypothetical protein